MQIVRPERRRRNLGLTPLIDVVFLLLIFFMLATTFLDTARVEVSVPQIDAAAPPDPDGPADKIRIVVGRAGQLTLNGEATPLAEIERQVRDRLNDAPDQPVEVAPGPAVPLQQVMAVLDRLAAAGATAVSLERPAASAPSGEKKPGGSEPGDRR